ncbi:MAG: hypothetical protein ACYC2H_12660 [Thermoplasmatota archaeon]
MPRLRCPRCASVVEVAAGAAPVCPSCGFGARPPTAPTSMAVPPIASPSRPATAAVPRPGASPPAAPSRRGAIIAICVVGVLVLAGAAAAVAYFAMRDGPAGALSEEEARQRVEASLQAAGTAFTGDASDGDLRKLTVEADPDESTPSGATDLFTGFGKMTMTVEYGKADRVKFDLNMASGAVTVAFTMICTPERQYMVAGGEAYASRPTVDGSVGDNPCREMDGMGLNESVPPLEELESEAADIERHDDGSLTATIDDPEDGRFVVEIDTKGRVRTITATISEDGQEMTMVMTYDYGDRSTIEVPTDFKLMPASVELDQQSDGATQTWTVTGSPEEPPLGDFEVRVQDFGTSFGFDGEEADPDAGLATFELEDAAEQTQGNLTFRFNDADTDGTLSAGDSFVVTDLSRADETTSEDEFAFDFSYFAYDVVLYDRVADGEVNSGFAEAPSPAWLALAALAFAGLVARRR